MTSKFDSLINLYCENTNLVANELKKGDYVKNINPQCKHSGTEGSVVGVLKMKGKGGICGNKVKIKIKKDPKHKGKFVGKEVEKTEIQLAKESKKNIHDPVRPGILKRAAGGGKLSCSKARSVKSKQKNKGSHTAKAAQRYLNYHC